MDILLGYVLIGLVISLIYTVYYRIIKTPANDKLFSHEPLKTLLILPVALTFTSIAWPYFIYLKIEEHNRPLPVKFAVEYEDLSTPSSVPDVEKLHIIDDPLSAVPPLPFGFLHHTWSQFLKVIDTNNGIYPFEKVDKSNVSFPQIKKGYAGIDKQKNVTFTFIYCSKSAR
ncbi:hypothetical protein [Thalassotalea sp. Y01]|uniref:hypothetical protein n=1 Tax=Thalassotalea sp. Y01 TaxID=2729613 RepID=UPI00145E554C|nr:hypothetical protein [Thalassotalea sp. Y01]NMP16350.1 hypothetical protein [Thalassotalea sp. Y01]